MYTFNRIRHILLRLLIRLNEQPKVSVKKKSKGYSENISLAKAYL